MQSQKKIISSWVISLTCIKIVPLLFEFVNTVGFIKSMVISFNIWFLWQIYLGLKRFFSCCKHWNWIPERGLSKLKITSGNYFLNDCHCHQPIYCSWIVYARFLKGVHWYYGNGYFWVPFAKCSVNILSLEVPLRRLCFTSHNSEAKN